MRPAAIALHSCCGGGLITISMSLPNVYCPGKRLYDFTGKSSYFSGVEFVSKVANVLALCRPRHRKREADHFLYYAVRRAVNMKVALRASLDCPLLWCYKRNRKKLLFWWRRWGWSWVLACLSFSVGQFVSILPVQDLTSRATHKHTIQLHPT